MIRRSRELVLFPTQWAAHHASNSALIARGTHRSQYTGRYRSLINAWEIYELLLWLRRRANKAQ